MHPYMMLGENEMYDGLFEPDGTLKRAKIQVKNFPRPIKIGAIEPKTKKTVIFYKHFNKFCEPVQTIYDEIFKFDNAIRYNWNIYKTKFIEGLTNNKN